MKNWLYVVIFALCSGSGISVAQNNKSEPDRARQEKLRQHIQLATKDPKALPQLQTVVPSYALPKNASEADRIRLLSKVTLFGIHSWYVGRINLPDETKTEWSGLYCRAHWTEFNGHVSHPDADRIKNDISDCLGVAVSAAIGAGLFTGDIGVASAAFKVALIKCLESKGVSWAKDLEIWVDSKDERGDWHYCL
jgi:hypothetical protein